MIHLVPGAIVRVLCIDDEADHLQISKTILERSGYEVLTLSDCRDLMKTVKEFQPMLIFLDHNMPQMTGTVATKMLKADPDSRHIPIVCFTSDNHIEKLAATAGADGWIRKPFDAGQLIATAQKFIAQFRTLVF